MDALGLLLVVVVTAANVQDCDGAHPLLALMQERFSTITLAWADAGYTDRLVTWADKVLRLAITVVKRTDPGFVVLPRRWVVERIFAWISKHRRCVRDYETLPANHDHVTTTNTPVARVSGCSLTPPGSFPDADLRGLSPVGAFYSANVELACGADQPEGGREAGSSASGRAPARGGFGAALSGPGVSSGGTRAATASWRWPGCGSDGAASSHDSARSSFWRPCLPRKLSPGQNRG